MDRYLTALRSKRDEVQAAIDAEYARPYPDGVILTGLKKIKLQLRERIERLESVERAARGLPSSKPGRSSRQTMGTWQAT